LHNSESFWRSVDRPPCDERHALIIDVVNEWDKDVFGQLSSYLSEYKQYSGWLCRGLTAAYMAFRAEAQRLNRVEHVKGAKGETIEREAMYGWYEKHYPRHGLGNGSGFAEFSRLLDEDPE
jgi:hypothetical protein